MSRTRGLVSQGLLAAALLAAAAGWALYGLGSGHKEVAARQRRAQSRVQAVTQGDTEGQDALDRVVTAREAYARRLVSLEDLLIKPDEKYLAEGKEDPANYFMQMLVSLRESCKKEGGPTFEGGTPLGFTGELKKKSEEEEKPERLALLRLQAAERLLRALRKAGTPHVVKIEHLTPRPATRFEELYEGVVVLPVQLDFAGTEKTVVAFLQAIASPGTTAGLENLELEATAEYEGITAKASLGCFFLSAADVLPERAEGPALTPGRRW